MANMACDTPPDVGAMTELTEEQCWEVLQGQEFGRLAYLSEAGLDLVPVNYAVHKGTLVFRTAAGSKLAAILKGGEVVFEVESFGEESASSVVVRAVLREMDHNEARWADQLRLRPWVPTVKEHVIVLEPTRISGRRFDLWRPWLHLRPHHH